MTQKLIEVGLSQASIAEAVTARGTPCSQPTIWRILKGKTDPSYKVGRAIQALYMEKVESAA